MWKEVLSSHHVESSRPSLTTVSLEVLQCLMPGTHYALLDCALISLHSANLKCEGQQMFSGMAHRKTQLDVAQLGL